MLFLKPEGRIDLDHRAGFLQGSPHRSVVVAVAKDGEYSILSSDLNDIEKMPPSVEGSGGSSPSIRPTTCVGR
jgi:hypothetical protein